MMTNVENDGDNSDDDDGDDGDNIDDAEDNHYIRVDKLYITYR
jgi:hypothetical protein